VAHLRAREQQLRELIVEEHQMSVIASEEQLDASWEENSAFLIKALEGARKGHGGRVRARVYHFAGQTSGLTPSPSRKAGDTFQGVYGSLCACNM
jgi:hypothetical protein